MTRVLVTGGGGFIGQHLGSELDAELVQRAMSGVGEVYHLAGLPGMWKPDRAEFHDVNYGGTENVLAIARKSGVARFLHCSTESILFHASQEDDAAAEEATLSVDLMPGPYT